MKYIAQRETKEQEIIASIAKASLLLN